MKAARGGRVAVCAGLVAGLMGVCAGTPLAAQDTKPELSWYGYVKLDASWDDAIVSAGNFARWTLSPESEDPNPHFNMTARQTRVGFRTKADLGSATIGARWEADFYGGGAENKNSLQVRHAYVEVVWPSGWSLLAGQGSDIISPRVPTTLNYTVAWWAGNIGYRRPQLRLTKRAAFGPAVLTLTGGATRTIGDDFGTADPGDTGAGSGVPTFQGHASLAVHAGARTAAVGAHVHRGKENLGDDLGGESLDIATSGWGLDWMLPLGPVALSGEFWTGSNLDDFFGGVGQGILIDESSAIGVTSTGGWSQLAWSRGATRAHLGAGLDDPKNEDIDLGFRSRNLVGWGNVLRDFGSGLSAGVEVSRWETRYVGLDDGCSWRVQGSMIYSF